MNASLVSERLQTFATRINDNDNAVGILLADTVVADQLKTTIENAAQASHKLDENMEALQHHFLLRGYFKKQAKRGAREAASSKGE
jgi:phospholipid/cholesterol/gamma-HCH transport system substrate-binding protein